MGAARNRLLNGVRKLQETNTLVEAMRADLAALQPVLASKAAACAELLGRVNIEQAEAERARAFVEAEETEVAALQQATQVRWFATAGYCIAHKQHSVVLMQITHPHTPTNTHTHKHNAQTPQAMADEAQADLDEALPALEAALASRKALNKVPAKSLAAWLVGHQWQML